MSVKCQKLSVIVPIYNEEAAIGPFYEELMLVIDELEWEAEVLFVNDGSGDTSADRLEALVQRDSRVRVVHLRRNFGQTAATQAGIDNARRCLGDDGWRLSERSPRYPPASRADRRRLRHCLRMATQTPRSLVNAPSALHDRQPHRLHAHGARVARHRLYAQGVSTRGPRRCAALR